MQSCALSNQSLFATALCAWLWGSLIAHQGEAGRLGIYRAWLRNRNTGLGNSEKEFFLVEESGR